MIHFGDICKMDGSKIPVVDIVTFGAPCQDISVAGKRKGMLNESRGDSETTRSGLFFEAIWGVPQRRKRIALVADFGGLAAPEILFERQGVSGNTEESREEGENTSQNAQRGIGETISFQERAGKAGGGKGILIQHERTGALSTLNNQSVLFAREWN